MEKEKRYKLRCRILDLGLFTDPSEANLKKHQSFSSLPPISTISILLAKYQQVMVKILSRS
jgi:hypothetical protein